MFGFNNSTPTYQGNGQPTNGAGGLLSGLIGYLFGGVPTPSYKGAEQPQSAKTSRLAMFGVRTPAYKAAPSTIPQTPAPTSAQAPAPDDGSAPDGWPPDCATTGGDEPPIFVRIR